MLGRCVIGAGSVTCVARFCCLLTESSDSYTLWSWGTRLRYGCQKTLYKEERRSRFSWQAAFSFLSLSGLIRVLSRSKISRALVRCFQAESEFGVGDLCRRLQALPLP
jgi:hypothetical protein